MTAIAETKLPEAEAAALASPFVATLVRLVRAQDAYGVWEGTSDADLLKPFLLTKEQRKTLPLMADPDPDVLARLELFYNAVSLTIERETGLVASPMMKMHHEGFGRVLLTTSRLVVLSRHLRDVHRFGFDSIEKLAADGNKLVAGGVEAINTYPEVARA